MKAWLLQSGQGYPFDVKRVMYSDVKHSNSQWTCRFCKFALSPRDSFSGSSILPEVQVGLYLGLRIQLYSTLKSQNKNRFLFATHKPIWRLYDIEKKSRYLRSPPTHPTALPPMSSFFDLYHLIVINSLIEIDTPPNRITSTVHTE